MIRSKLKNPDKISELKEAIADLKKKIEKRKKALDSIEKAETINKTEEIIEFEKERREKVKSEADSLYEKARKLFEVEYYNDAKSQLENAKSIYAQIKDTDGITRCDELLSKITMPELEEKPPAPIEIKRDDEILPNNDLRFGIRITNNTDYLIADVKTTLDFPEPETLFSLKGNEVQRLGTILPGSKRTAEYILTPLGCIHNETIDAAIIYKDHTGERHTVQMRPKEVHCVCPFLREKQISEREFAEFAAKSESVEERLIFSGIGTSELADFLKTSYKGRLYHVSEIESSGTIVLNLAGESLGEKVCYLLSAIIQPRKEENVIQITFWAYSDKPHGLHGFLSEITQSVRQRVEQMPHVHEVEIIEHYELTNSFRLIRDFEKYCNSRYAASEIMIDKLEVVYYSLKAAEPITKDVLLPLVEENLNAMREIGVEEQKERGMRMCEKLVELLHIATSNLGDSQEKAW